MIRHILTVILVTVCGAVAQAKNYEFAQPPVKALETLTKLKHLSTGRPGASADELALFQDAADGKLDQHSFADAALLASGVVDLAKRKAYLAKIDQLEKEARQAVASAKTPAEKGEKLLQFLHAGIMKPGYETQQTSLAEVIDTGKFNCVSSAVIYNILALRLGLDARGCLVFGHAFSVVYVGGKAMDVETTNERGFNPGDPDVQKEIAEKTGKKPSTDTRDRKEVRELGLIASIYANRSAQYLEDKHFYDSLLCGFGALALHPTCDTGQQNATAGLTNWGKELTEEKKFETALVVLAVSQEIAPKEYGVGANREACWQDWIKHVHETQGEEASRKLAKKLLADFPKERPLRDIVRSHISREMDKLQDDKKYREALALLGRNRELVGEEREINDMKAFCWQEWIKTTSEQGEAAARTLIVQLVKENAGEKELAEIVSSHVIRGMNKLRDEKKYEEALAYIARHKEVLSPAETKQLRISMYDAWAFSHKPKWQAGIDVYKKALVEYPDDGHLTNNLKYFEQENKK